MGGVLFIVTVKGGGGQGVVIGVVESCRDPILEEFPDMRGSDVWRLDAFLRVRQLNRPCKPKPTYCGRRRV